MNKKKIKKKLRCNRCGHIQTVKDYNPLDLYYCEKCGNMLAEINDTFWEDIK